jgi:hypothetical protein
MQRSANLTQGLRGHFGSVEDIANSSDQARRHLWIPRLARGDIVGNAWSEIGLPEAADGDTFLRAMGGARAESSMTAAQ